MFIIGSQALTYYLPLDRMPADHDLIGTYDEIINHRKSLGAKICYPIAEGKKMLMRLEDKTIIEADIAWPGSAEERLYHFLQSQTDNIDDSDGFSLPSLDVLYLLKMSHRYKKNSPHFLKTMHDIHLMRNHGAVIRPEHEPFYKQRMKDTYTYGHPKLNVDKKTFFADSVPYVYDHDSIHRSVSVGLDPAYTLYAVDGEEVKSSKDLFFKCNESARLNGVVEEAMVLAIERSLVPFPGGKTPGEAWGFALNKVCTSITSGWFREYAWEHYYPVVQRYHELNVQRGCYWEQFQQNVAAGRVKMHEPAKETV